MAEKKLMNVTVSTTLKVSYIVEVEVEAGEYEKDDAYDAAEVRIEEKMGQLTEALNAGGFNLYKHFSDKEIIE